MIARAPSRCGCSDHCTFHESAGPVEQIDCLPAALMCMARATYGIERLIGDATDPDWHPDTRARARATLRMVLADLHVASALVDGFVRAAVGE